MPFDSSTSRSINPVVNKHADITTGSTMKDLWFNNIHILNIIQHRDRRQDKVQCTFRAWFSKTNLSEDRCARTPWLWRRTWGERTNVSHINRLITCRMCRERGLYTMVAPNALCHHNYKFLNKSLALPLQNTKEIKETNRNQQQPLDSPATKTVSTFLKQRGQHPGQCKCTVLLSKRANFWEIWFNENNFCLRSYKILKLCRHIPTPL